MWSSHPFLSLEEVLHITGLSMDDKPITTGLDMQKNIANKPLLGMEGVIKRAIIFFQWLGSNSEIVPKATENQICHTSKHFYRFKCSRGIPATT